MRLSTNEKELIKSTIKEHIDDARIILFGSRADDEKKGGDIDLLVQTNQKVSLQTKLRILTQLQMRGIQRKMDLLFQTPYTKKSEIFTTALETGVEL